MCTARSTPAEKFGPRSSTATSPCRLPVIMAQPKSDHDHGDHHGQGRKARVTKTRAFVGRAAELTTLDECLRAAADGQTQVVLLAGEPGVGKTRLAARVAE